MNLAKKIHRNESNNAKPIDVIKFMLHDGLHPTAPDTWTIQEKKAAKERERLRSVGVIHVTTSKESLQHKTVVFTNFESLEQRLNSFTHFTPQIYMWGRSGKHVGRTHSNVRWYGTFMVDFDCDITTQEIMYLAYDKGLPEPNVILSTPNGKQAFYVVDQAFVGSDKARNAAKYVAKVLRNAFGKHADQFAPVLGFSRIPKEDNLEYVNFSPVSSTWLLTWAKTEERTNPSLSLPKKGNTFMYSREGLLNDPAIQALLKNTVLVGQKGGVLGRNNAIFTLGLALKYEGKSEQEIHNTIDEWNTNLNWSLGQNEVRNIVRSVMKPEYKAPSKSAVEALTGMRMKFKYNIITPKKPREERERSHLWEWENDLVAFIEANTSAASPFVVDTIRGLAEKLGMAKQSFQAVLKRSKQLIKRTVGKGCKAFTLITTRSVMKKANTYQSKVFLLNNSLTVQSNDGEDISFNLEARPEEKSGDSPPSNSNQKPG